MITVSNDCFLRLYALPLHAISAKGLLKITVNDVSFLYSYVTFLVLKASSLQGEASSFSNYDKIGVASEYY